MTDPERPSTSGLIDHLRDAPRGVRIIIGGAMATVIVIAVVGAIVAGIFG